MWTKNYSTCQHSVLFVQALIIASSSNLLRDCTATNILEEGLQGGNITSLKNLHPQFMSIDFQFPHNTHFGKYHLEQEAGGLRGLQDQEAAVRCQFSPPIDEYLNDITNGDFNDPNSLFNLFGLSELASVHFVNNALVYGIETEGQGSFGRNGEYTTEILVQHLLASVFWDVPLGTVVVNAVHSSKLSDPITLRIAFLDFLDKYDIDSDTLNIDLIMFDAANYIENMPLGYSNPALTFNAVAYNLPALAGASFTQYLIEIGDGILDFFTSEGLGTIGSDFIHAHEFAHILQYRLDKDKPTPEELSAEESRLAELEADAMASYFLAHQDGRDFSIGELLKVIKAAFSIGDCDYTAPGHHGTPLQRQCAALWGANTGLPDEENLSPREFRDEFNAALSMILAIDPSICLELQEEEEEASNPMTPEPTAANATPEPTVAGRTPEPTANPTSEPTSSSSTSTSSPTQAPFSDTADRNPGEPSMIPPSTKSTGSPQTEPRPILIPTSATSSGVETSSVCVYNVLIIGIVGTILLPLLGLLPVY